MLMARRIFGLVSCWLMAIGSAIAGVQDPRVVRGLDAVPAPTPAHGEEYEFRAQGESSAVALNRAQGVRFELTGAGLRVRELDEDESRESVELRTVAVAGCRIGSAGIRHLEGLRATFEHGEYVEWFEHDSRGLEQGWTLREPGDLKALAVILSIHGAGVLISESGLSLRLVDERGRDRFRYHSLAAFDARGRELTARFVSAPAGAGVPGGIGIDVEGLSRAAFPVTIDPILGGPAWSAEGNQAGVAFSATISTAGDVNGDGYSDVLIGAPSYRRDHSGEGAAFLYFGSPDGLSDRPDWVAFGGQADANFGNGLSTAGDVNGDGYGDIVVAAPQYDDPEEDEGKVWLYLGGPDGPGSSADWSFASDQMHATLGQGVCTAGDVDGDGYDDLIVAARRYDGSTMNAGVVWGFHGSPTGLSLTPDWEVRGNQTDAAFGVHVATAGDVDADGFADVVVGAVLHDNGELNEGRTFLYLGSPAGLSTTAAWTAESDSVEGQLGSVRPTGDVNGDGYSDVSVGAFRYSGIVPNGGAAFIYLGSPGGVSSSPDWSFFGPEANDFFGIVSTAGDTDGDGYADMLVGSLNANGGLGSVHLHFGSATGPAPVPDLVISGTQVGALFGRTVATAGDVNGDGFADFLISEVAYDGGQVGEGRVWLHLGCGSVPEPQSDWTSAGGRPAYGARVADAGDVNADGYGDLIVSAPLFPSLVQDGWVGLHLGGPAGPSMTTAWTVTGDSGDQLGSELSGVGDVNGDGFDDVVLGAEQYLSGNGRASLYLGSASGLELMPAWDIVGSVAISALGFAIAGAGDVDADGYADVLVSTRLWSGGGVIGAGQVELYHGSASGLEAVARWSQQGVDLLEQFGFRVAGAGDVDGDGFSDVLISSEGNANGGTAVLYRGGFAGLEATPSWSIGPFASYPHTLETAGDVNGDGFSDVLVGEALFSNPEPSEGRIMLFLGSSSGLGTRPAFEYESDVASAQLGNSSAGLGDVNGDGYGDFAVGAPGYPAASGGTGAVFLFLGSASGPGAAPTVTLDGGASSISFGRDISAAGDVDGDGFSDVLVGDPNEQTMQLSYGNGGSGIARAIRQVRPGDGVRIGVGNRSDSGRFRMEAVVGGPGVLATPAGRGRVSLEWSVAPTSRGYAEQDFGSGDTIIETGILGTQFMLEDEVVIPGDAPYRWRARIATNNPFFPHGPWLHLGGVAPGETMLRPNCSGLCNSSFCFGQACPCGNDDPSAGCKTSTGNGILLLASGTSSLAADDLSITATGAVAGNLGLLFAADTQLGAPLDVGDGLVCIGGGAYRFAPSVSSPAGTFTQSDVFQAPGEFFAAGQTWYFQLWMRDVFCTPLPIPCPSPCGNGTNLSNAIGILFGP